MLRPPPRYTRSATLFPYAALVRSAVAGRLCRRQARPGPGTARREGADAPVAGTGAPRCDGSLHAGGGRGSPPCGCTAVLKGCGSEGGIEIGIGSNGPQFAPMDILKNAGNRLLALRRSDEHTSELQSLLRISYAVFCLKKNTQQA